MRVSLQTAQRVSWPGSHAWCGWAWGSQTPWASGWSLGPSFSFTFWLSESLIRWGSAVSFWKAYMDADGTVRFCWGSRICDLHIVIPQITWDDVWNCGCWRPEGRGAPHTQGRPGGASLQFSGCPECTQMGLLTKHCSFLQLEHSYRLSEHIHSTDCWSPTLWGSLGPSRVPISLTVFEALG